MMACLMLNEDSGVQGSYGTLQARQPAFESCFIYCDRKFPKGYANDITFMDRRLLIVAMAPCRPSYVNESNHGNMPSNTSSDMEAGARL